ncbi:PE family protein [Mycobacterium kansasii 732]|nr:PE family protein [Mycobacterium kansasii 732]
MSFVISAPEALLAATRDLADIGSTLSAANEAAAGPTTRVLAAGADEVSAGIAALFGSHGAAYQALCTEAAAFHDQFSQALSAARRLICQRRGRQRPADPDERADWRLGAGGRAAPQPRAGVA